MPTDADLLPADLLETSLSREAGVAVWALDDAAAVLAACRERRLLPVVAVIVEVTGDATHPPGEDGPWHVSAGRAWQQHALGRWDRRVAAAVDTADALAKRAQALHAAQPERTLLFVLRVASHRGRPEGVSPLALLAAAIIGPVGVWLFVRGAPPTFVDAFMAKPLLRIAQWCAGAGAFAATWFLADVYAAFKARREAPPDDGPRRPPKVVAPALIARLAVVGLVLWAWAPMGAVMIWAVFRRF